MGFAGILFILLLLAVVFTTIPIGEWLCWRLAGLVRIAVRTALNDSEAELWAARFRNAAEEGLRDRDAKKDRP